MEKLLFLLFVIIPVSYSSIPLAINTWSFTNATEKAWEVLQQGGSYLDALEQGCTECEVLQCDGTVGYGGGPDESGETTLDAMIFDGVKMDMGAVGALRRIKSAISVARHVLEHTKLSFLVGDQATEFAVQMGFHEEPLNTVDSTNLWKEWKTRHCQPNNWLNVEPDPTKQCGPYRPLSENSIRCNGKKCSMLSKNNHDTIGMIIIDEDGNIAAGTSTNGLKFKIPGRVGDSPIPGAGAYADAMVGAASATGDGDVMMRFLPSFYAVEELRRGRMPNEAAEAAMLRIASVYPNFFGGIIVTNKEGEYAAACNGMDEFTYSVVNNELGKVVMKKVHCIKKSDKYESNDV